MKRLRILAAVICLPLLTAGMCVSGDPVVAVSADNRPPCRPAASLMVEPGLLPAVHPGANMFRTLASWAVAYNALRRAMIDLQRHVARECQ